MSKILGIISEYNPFHNGHLYHLQKSKELTNCEYTIAIMSGNFTQRGSTSIIDKWEKAKMALSNGIDLVIELPTLYSISSAENFADGAIKLLNSLGIVDYLSFGSETDNIESLKTIAQILYSEPEEYKSNLANELKKGQSFPKAREKALSNYLSNNDIQSNILTTPNNILGVEYLKALLKYNSTIQPICISRFESEYNSNNISNNIASATAIRTLIKNKNFDTIKNLITPESNSILMDNINNGHIISDLDIFEKEIIYILRRMSIEEIRNLPDVSEGLEYSIKKASNSCNTLSELLNIIKSKRYTQTRIQRILLYALLGITKNDMEISKNTIPYIRVLGFNKNGKKLLSEISKNTKLALITSVKKFINANYNPSFKQLLDIDILSTDIYTIGFKHNSLSSLDLRNQIIKHL